MPEEQEQTQAERDAGPVGCNMAAEMLDKIREAIDGLPASSPTQRRAIAGLICEGLETYQDELLAA